MIKSKLGRYMMHSLKRGRRVKLGPLEMLSLAIAGYRDGRYGLPKEDEEGEWTSPRIQKEMNACNESHRKIYGTMQIRLERRYRRANELVDKLAVYERRIEELTEQKPTPPTDAELKLRMHGEEGLSDSQVQRRRRREYNLEREKYSTLTIKLKERAEKELEELIELRSYLLQVNNEAELVCDRIMSHIQQRIDFYWNAAIHARAKTQSDMPAVYRRLPIPSVPAEYQCFHEKEEERMEKIIDRFKRYKEAV